MRGFKVRSFWLVGFFLLFNIVACSGTKSPAVLRNIYLEPELDPYEVSDYRSESEYFKSKGFNIEPSTVGSDSEDPLIRPPIFPLLPDISGTIEESINRRAREVDQPYYLDAKARGFSLPRINVKGQIFDFYPSVKQLKKTFPAPGLNDPESGGIARVLPNSIYRDLAYQTYALSIFDTSGTGVSGGSAFLIDYELSDDGSYPRRFFFATNVHVWLNAKLELDKDSRWSLYQNPSVQFTKTISLTHLKEGANIGKILPTTASSSDFEELVIDLKTAKAKTVFMGIDFLDTSPSNWTGDPNWRGSEEIADLAIFELTFTDEVMKQRRGKDNVLDPSSAVASFTSHYAERPASRKFRLADVVDLQKPLQIKDRSFLAVGYPNSSYDEYLDPITDSQYYSERNFTRSLWINKPKRLYKIVKEGGKSDLMLGGFRPTASRSYRSFMHQVGLVDLTIISPRFPGRDLDKPFFEVIGRDGKRLRLIYYGLGYVIDDFAANKGASGSPVIDSNYKFVSIHFASDPWSSTGISAAFRSPGFNYKGYYSKYNLETYDLIYGGGLHQKDSYRRSLIRLYGPHGIRTDLFPKGPVG